MEKKDLKIAIVHDFLVQYGGAEKVLEAIAEMFPEAPIYTLLYNKEKMHGKFEGKDIRPSYLQKFPKFLRHHYRWLLPFFPVMPETFNLRDFGLVISSSGAWSKGIVTKLDTIHIAYLHSPMRFVWDYHEQYIREVQSQKLKVQSSIENFFLRPILNYLRIWDRLAADRPDHIIVNSKYTQERVKKYYRRESTVIYPPVNVDNVLDVVSVLNGKNNQLEQAQRLNKRSDRTLEQNYFLIVSRLSPYKKVDLAVEAFNKLGFPLVIIGEGRQKKYLEKIAGKNVKILGWKNENELKKYYTNARAFIFPAIDDFGITIVESMSYGIPVIAFRDGGAKEIVREGIEGEFFGAQTAEVLADSVRRFIGNEKKYNPEEIKKRAQEFSKERFVREFGEYINKIFNF
jgi:glycosyltransferase involved in cell wall biosynthesis